MRDIVKKVQPIEGKLLTWPDIWTHLHMSKNKKDRWMTSCETPPEVEDFLNLFGYTVTRHFNGQDGSQGGQEPKVWVGLNNNQLATIVLFQGFANYLCKKLPELALEIGIGTEVYHGSKV